MRVWDLSDYSAGEQLVKYDGRVQQINLHPRQPYLLVLGFNETTLSLTDMKETTTFEKSFGGLVTGADFFPNSKRVAVLVQDRCPMVESKRKFGTFRRMK